MKAMENRLNSTGAAAAAANRPIAFSTPENKAVRQTKNRYGNMIRVSATAIENFAALPEKPGASAYSSHGMKISPSAVRLPSQNTITAVASSAKPCAEAMPSTCRIDEIDGTKAALKAPSPNSRRNKLGSRSATKNASATGPVPRMAAIRISRAKPRMRLAIVHIPTVKAPRSMARN